MGQDGQQRRSKMDAIIIYSCNSAEVSFWAMYTSRGTLVLVASMAKIHHSVT